MSDQLQYIRDAINRGDTKVQVIRAPLSQKTGRRVITGKPEVNPVSALKFLSLPVGERPFIYKHIFPISEEFLITGQTAPQKVDMNPLSSDEMIQRLLADPEALKALKAAEKAQKAKEKSESEQPTEPETETQNPLG